MGRWRHEEVAGDRYIYDLSETPYAFGIPQGACRWAIQGEQDAAAMMACEAHNADVDACEARIAELEAQCVTERQQAAAHYQARIDAVLAQFGEIECDSSCGITWTCTRCQAHAHALAIAEGRDDD